MIDHELLHKTVYEYGGLIVGGYMRAWVSRGEPTGFGWNDVDIYGVDKTLRTELREKVKEATGGRGTDFKYTGIVRNFYCNSWVYDGFSIYREKTEYGEADDLEVLEQTKAKQAVLISESVLGAFVTKREIFKYMRKYNFTIHHSDGSIMDLGFFQDLWSHYSSIPISQHAFSSDAEKTVVEHTLKNIMQPLA